MASKNRAAPTDVTAAKGFTFTPSPLVKACGNH
jgi:hypothetical protein